MKKEKGIIIMLVVLLVLLIIAAIVITYIGIKQIKPKEVDLANINTEILAEGSFDNGRMKDITLDNITELLMMDQTGIIDVIGKIPLLNISSSMYVVVHVTPDKVESVKEQLERYGEQYEKEWSSYIEDQYMLVKNRKIGVIEDKVYLVISDVADEIEKMIKES